MSLTLYDHPTGAGVGSGPINPSVDEVGHKLLLRNGGLGVVWIASSSGDAAAVTARGDLGDDDVYPLAPGDEIEFGIEPNEQYYYNAPGVPVSLYVWYW